MNNSSKTKNNKLKNALVDYIHVVRTMTNKNDANANATRAYGSRFSSPNSYSVESRTYRNTPRTKNNQNNQNNNGTKKKNTTRDVVFGTPPSLFTKRF